MTTAAYIASQVLPVAAALLPPQMASGNAFAMLMAIGRQESGFKHRRQVNGPARGFWQFEEQGGVAGVLEHHASRHSAASVLATLGYPNATARTVHAALEHNDVLAACFARLLLWTDARALPSADGSTQGWLLYLSTWRPGKPHPETWGKHFEAAWSVDFPGTVRT